MSKQTFELEAWRGGGEGSKAVLLAVIRWAKTAENSTDYSLNNTVRNEPAA